MRRPTMAEMRTDIVLMERALTACRAVLRTSIPWEVFKAEDGSGRIVEVRVYEPTKPHGGVVVLVWPGEDYASHTHDPELIDDACERFDKAPEAQIRALSVKLREAVRRAVRLALTL